ncbi:hypothetical protein [Aureimonas leprariae]|uniref:Uncharacterized protein n=1 Tax=Plantimonas leprariae TaxID=2615207 RepID=A0A7V7PKE0_9HYPH|nr:hypothetical protein [Aureimonas leprariae]KAB0676017.1 hypothetical protein F6X38_22410 [Aureimonas leprariae]
MRLFYAAATLLLSTIAAFAEGEALFQNFEYGTERQEIVQSVGATPCGESGNLCVRNQTFAGEPVEYVFLFREGLLTNFRLIFENREDAVAAMTAVNGTKAWLPVWLQRSNTGQTVDVLLTMHRSGPQEAASQAMSLQSEDEEGTYTASMLEKSKDFEVTKFGSFVEALRGVPSGVRRLDVVLNKNASAFTFSLPADDRKAAIPKLPKF